MKKMIGMLQSPNKMKVSLHAFILVVKKFKYVFVNEVFESLFKNPLFVCLLCVKIVFENYTFSFVIPNSIHYIDYILIGIVIGQVSMILSGWMRYAKTLNEHLEWVKKNDLK